MKQDLARLWKLYRTVGRLLPGYFLTGTAVACRNYFITLLNVYLGANVATQCAAGNLSVASFSPWANSTVAGT